jgi:hypothetical protein
MANFVFNIAKGKVAEKVADGATIKLLVLKTAASDATNKDFDTVSAILAGGNTEADFTNYARKTLASLTATVDDTTDLMAVDCADVTFTAAGGASNNTTTDVIIYEDPGTGDANCVPLVQLDAVFTTDGNNVTLTINASGFFTAS